MQGFLRTSEREGLITSRQRLDFPGGSAVKIRPQCRRCQFSPGGSGRPPGAGHGNPLSVLPREVPWAEEPGGLPSAGSHRVGPTQRLNSSHEAVSRAALLSAPEGFGGARRLWRRLRSESALSGGRVRSGVIARAGQAAHLASSALCERRQAGRTHGVLQGREKGRPGVRGVQRRGLQGGSG